jgi:hypothetical protein
MLDGSLPLLCQQEDVTTVGLATISSMLVSLVLRTGLQATSVSCDVKPCAHSRATTRRQEL